VASLKAVYAPQNARARRRLTERECLICGISYQPKRNAIERMFCRLKDFRRIATRYDRLAKNFLAAVCIAAAVNYWL
jgi:transposase